jgi:erythromycin esterase
MELLSNHPAPVKEVKATGSLVGVVLGPDGNPVDFALVAAVSLGDDPEDGKPPILTTSLNRGRFEFADLPPGNYGLTVTSPEANAAAAQGSAEGSGAPSGSYAGVVTVAPGEAGPPMLVRLGGQGITFSGRLTDDQGKPLSGALVRAVRESPFEGDHFFAKTGDDGQFHLAVPAARYYLVAHADGKRPVRVDVQGEQAPKEISIRMLAEPAPPPRGDLTAWISKSGGVLTSVDGADTADLAPLRDVVGSARVVGLGDASYTGSESWKLRQRMFRYLVENMGFSVLLIEAGQADARALDEHVTTGKGKLSDVLAGLGYFCFDTQEAAALFSWMRIYNEDRKHKKKLRVMGLDVQRTAAPATLVELYLARVDRAFLSQVETTLDRMRVNDFGVDYRKRPADEQDKVTSDLDLIEKQLEKSQARYVGRSSAADYHLARTDALALSWAARVYRDEAQRGPALADVARRAIEAQPRGTKVALWAHDAYVSRRKADGGMGALLAEAYKADYVAIASTFYQGWIRAWDFTQGPTLERGTKLFRLAPADSDSLEGLLDTAGAPLFFADVRKAPPSLAPWFESRLPMRSISTVFTSDRRSRVHTVVKEAFDALVFVRKQSTVTFNETGARAGKQEWE